jgi:uncharacterized membrane protein
MRSRPEPLALLLALASCTDGQGPSTSDDDSTGAAASTGEAGSTGATAEPMTYPSLAERPCPEDSILTAEDFGAAFMLTYCTGCHHGALPDGERAGAPVGVDFETLAKVRAHADRIWARAGDQNATMPPVGPPPADERALLGEWLACGAPSRADL